MRNVDWPRVLAKAFAVLTSGVGVGFLVGGLAFVQIGEDGFLRNSPFGHIAEVIGIGAGSLMACLSTAIAMYRPPAIVGSKPDILEENRLE